MSSYGGMEVSEQLKHAREYEERMEKNLGIPRPKFHFSSRIGWMNDPNGFSHFGGECHLFYQYHPYSKQWGPMHWGHAKTKDYITWEYLPCALAPDEEYDAGGCFSGSAIEWQDKHILAYTGVTKEEPSRQIQCIAVGDGLEYQKIKENPVIDSGQLPEGASTIDFRDPKIYVEDNIFKMVVANRDVDGDGQILQYQSTDLKNWEFVSVLDKSNQQIGRMWECPDYFSLQGKDILIFSPQEMVADGEFHNGNCVAASIGRYEMNKKCLEREHVHSVDYGLDFYAPQTMQSPDGRRILIGWMQSWENPIYPTESNWVGMMTIPRELTLKDQRLYQSPVREIENYYTKSIDVERCCIESETGFPGVEGECFDMEVELSGNAYQEFEIKMGQSGGRYISFSYDRKKKQIGIDRLYSGLKKDLICQRSLKVRDYHDKLKVRLIRDLYSLEVFVGDGEYVMSMCFFLPEGAGEIRFASDGLAEAKILFHSL